MVDSRRAGALASAIVDFLIVGGVLLLFCEEAFTVAGLSWTFRRPLVFAGIGLDMAFTAEFGLRFALARSEFRIGSYLLGEAGWAEGLSSLVVLALFSGPLLFSLSTTGEVSCVALSDRGGLPLQALPSLASLRLLRLLRFFPRGDRIAMLGGSNERFPSPRRGRAAPILGVLLVFTLVADTAGLLGVWPDAGRAFADKRLSSLSALLASPNADTAESVAGVDDDLLLVRRAGQVLYTRHAMAFYSRSRAPDDLGYLREAGGMEAFFSLVRENKARSVAVLITSLVFVAIFGMLFPPQAQGRAAPSGEAGKEGASVGARRDRPSPGPMGPEELSGLLQRQREA